MSDALLQAILGELKKLNSNVEQVLCAQKLQAMRWAEKQRATQNPSELEAASG